jgi:hypothetical protein
MRVLATVAILFTTAAALAQAPPPLQRVVDDAKAIDRVAEMSKRDLPRDVLKRIITEDIELLRGRHNDGSYDYAGFERLESGRIADSFSVNPRKDEQLSTFDIKGSFIYRLILDVPSRRMLVTKNRRVFVDHVDIEYIPEKGSGRKTQTEKVEAWLEPGSTRVVELEAIARQATVRIYAHADKDMGYGNVDVTLVQARVFDDPGSPYADAVKSAKSVQRAIDSSEIPSIRSMAARIVAGLAPSLPPAASATASTAGTPASRVVEVIAPRAEPAPARVEAAIPTSPALDVTAELQAIEDLLTGREAEKRQGMDRLHQLIRKNRR